MSHTAGDTIDAIARHERAHELALHESNIRDIAPHDHSSTVAEFNRHAERLHEIMHDERRRLSLGLGRSESTPPPRS